MSAPESGCYPKPFSHLIFLLAAMLYGGATLPFIYFNLLNTSNIIIKYIDFGALFAIPTSWAALYAYFVNNYRSKDKLRALALPPRLIALSFFFQIVLGAGLAYAAIRFAHRFGLLGA